MGLYRNEFGSVIEMPDEFANAAGLEPVSAAERADINTQKGIAARGEERGIVGDINAAATGLASGLTFGLSDMALAESLTPLERERLLSEIGAHPYLRGAGEIGGAVAGAFAAPGSALAKTPAGYLGNVAAREVEAGLAQGGLRGTAKALGTMGAEGAIQSAGSYLGHSALEDKEATVEGLSGALGTGFSFGAVGGGAVLGVAKGAIAARRLYSRVMDGRKGAQAAESAWSQVSEEALQADRSMAQAAEIKLNTIKEGKIAAQRYLNETNAMARETAPIERAAAEPEAFVGPSALDEGIAPAKGGVPTSVRQAPAEVRGPVTQKLTAPESELEAQLAGTKAKLDEGAALKEIKVPKPVKASKGNESDSIEGWLSEKKAFDDAELSQVRRVEDLKGAAELRNRRASTLDDIRYEATARLLGTQIAKEERVIAEAYEKFQTAAKDATPILRARGAGPEEFAPVSTAAASPGNRKAVEILDSAHEEALLRAKHAADPQEAGRAYSQAEELENLLENLATPRLTPSQGLTRGELRAPQAEQWIRELHGDIGKLQRYEKASAELAEALGDAAPQTAVLRAKAFRQAEDDSLRKVRDRMTRAADDADTFGPEYRTPKQRQNEARANLDEMKVREQEARLEHGAASKKVKEGERAKKAALKTAGAGGGTADALGWMEWLDLPGIPKLSDLPVIGPLVGGLLKMRTMKRAMGGVMGKVPATADNRVAALAAQTRDRIARAVDRSLGALERGGKYATRAIPAPAGILAARIFDDGGPDPGKNATIAKQAAARMREINAYVNTPGAIEKDVRRELAGVVDPDIIEGAEKHRRAVMEYLLKNSPKVPEQSILKKIEWEPSPAEAMAFARRMDAINDPAGFFERMASNGTISLEGVDAVGKLFPRLFQQAQMRLMERSAEMKLNVPYRTRVQMSLTFKMPLDSALEPDNLKITQSVYERKPSSPAYNPAAEPQPRPSQAMPSIANPVDISKAYTPSMDRR